MIVAAGVLVMFRQSRFGWHVLATGGNRKAARHGGIQVKGTIFLAYVLAGLIVGLSGFLYAARRERRRLRHRRRHGVLRPDRSGRGPRRLRARARLDRRGDDRLRHDLHSQQRAPQRGPSRRFRPARDGRHHSSSSFPSTRSSGSTSIGCWLRPMSIRSTSRSTKSTGAKGFMPDEIAPKLVGAELLASGMIDGPEDVILDADDNLYCGTRDGRLVRIAGARLHACRDLRANRRPAARPRHRSGGTHRRLRRGDGPRARQPASGRWSS